MKTRLSRHLDHEKHLGRDTMQGTQIRKRGWRWGSARQFGTVRMRRKRKRRSMIGMDSLWRYEKERDSELAVVIKDSRSQQA